MQPRASREGFASGDPILRQFREGQPSRKGDAGSERERFPGAERGYERQKVGGAVGDRGAQERLIAIVGHPHGEQSSALRDDRGVEFRRTLRRKTEMHAVFPALLSDAEIARRVGANPVARSAEAYRGPPRRRTAAGSNRRSRGRNRRRAGRRRRQRRRPPRPEIRRAA